MYPPDAHFPVYCNPCWWSDKWEATDYGQEYDFSKPFFQQYEELQNKVPRFHLWQRNAINSDYSNNVGESKNVYLSVSVVLQSENIFYSKSIDACFNIFDSLNLKNCENCYENIEGEKNYNSQHLYMSRNCIDSYFLFDCVNCSSCFMCSNLRNKQFCIKNEQFTKDDYLKRLEKINLKKRSQRKEFIKEFERLCKDGIYRFANTVNTVNSTGNNLQNTKNCKHCFDVYNAEDLKYCDRAFISKDAMDYDYGLGSELMYEYITGAKNAYNVRFSSSANNNVRNAEYINSCVNVNDAFGCIGVRNKNNIVLNKVYSKEEFCDLKEKIIKHMNDMPYVGKKGRIYKYGEFFPIEISPFAYNETSAQEFQPMTKNEIEKDGYRWREHEEKNYQITINTIDIPDDIAEVEDTVLEDVLACEHTGSCNHQCSRAFRITSGELQFYRKNNISLPTKCPNC
ncbi:MAG: hypothetical protein AAB815_00550, partial [Patescibacteria group bacterium]